LPLLCLSTSFLFCFLNDRPQKMSDNLRTLLFILILAIIYVNLGSAKSWKKHDSHHYKRSSKERSRNETKKNTSTSKRQFVYGGMGPFGGPHIHRIIIHHHPGNVDLYNKLVSSILSLQMSRSI